MTWRQQFAPTIARVIARITDPTQPIDKPTRARIRKELRAVWTTTNQGAIDTRFKYTAWKQEARFQMGLDPPPRDRGRPPRFIPLHSFPDPRQAELFAKLVNPELRLIESVMRAAEAGRSPGGIFRAAPPGLLTYPQIVRILTLAGMKKTPAQIQRYLEDDEKQRLLHKPEERKNAEPRFRRLPRVSQSDATDVHARKRGDKRQVSKS